MHLPCSEKIEWQALHELHEIAPEPIRLALGLQCYASKFGLISVASALPASAIVINRALGLGLAQPMEWSEIEKLLARYKASRVSRYFVQVHPDSKPAELEGWLLQQGLQEARAWQKFERDAGSVEPKECDLEVKKIGADNGVDFAKIVCAGFDLGEQAEPWLALLPSCEHWHVFMTFSEGEPAGVGAIYIRDGVGWLDFASTAPEFRCRGSQGAILAARINYAAELGCSKIFTCTGVDVPGDPQHSYSNILKYGFNTTYERKNFAPPKTS